MATDWFKPEARHADHCRGGEEMPKEDLSREIEALRSQVADLQSQCGAIKEPAGAGESEMPVEEASPSDKTELFDFKGIQPHLEELIQELEREFKDLPAMPAIAIFALGILVGRFLSR
jgi:hypothetical protein